LESGYRAIAVVVAREVVVLRLSEAVVAGDADIGRCLVEACDGATVHVLVFPVPAVN
jgi:hypothetical protein